MNLRSASLALTLAATASLFASAQHVMSATASIVDVAGRQRTLANTTDPLLRSAIKSLPSCVESAAIPAPSGPMEIPHHYLSGSHGPVNPAEAPATAPYNQFEKRITAGMNRFLANRSHAEAACAEAQLDAWAQSNALLNYDPKDFSQSWYQVEWTLSSAAITQSVLLNDSALNPAQTARINRWLNAVAHKLISFEKPGEAGNNHHYWRALAAAAAGVVSGDDALFTFGVQTYKQAINQLDPSGAFPLEMARHERALHYQAFALQPLIVLAQLAGRQQVELFGFTAHGRSLRDAIVFFGRAVDDPALVTPYTTEPQLRDFAAGDFAPFVIYAARFPHQPLPASLSNAMQHPLAATRIGGSTTLLAGS